MGNPPISTYVLRIIKEETAHNIYKKCAGEFLKKTKR